MREHGRRRTGLDPTINAAVDQPRVPRGVLSRRYVPHARHTGVTDASLYSDASREEPLLGFFFCVRVHTTRWLASWHLDQFWSSSKSLLGKPKVRWVESIISTLALVVDLAWYGFYRDTACINWNWEGRKSVTNEMRRFVMMMMIGEGMKVVVETWKVPMERSHIL